MADILVPNAPQAGMTLISTTALSGTSTVISNIPQNYTDLYVFINSLTFSASAELNFTVNSVTNYYNVRRTQATFTAESAASKIRTSTSSVSWGGTVLVIPQYSFSSYHVGRVQSFDFNAGANLETSFNINNTAAITSFTVTSQAGTATMSAGNVYLYGVK